MPKRESLHHAYPNYRVDLEPSGARMLASLGGEVVADSRHALIVRETKCDPVVYFPLVDVRSEFLRPSDHQTFCPFKGEASYWTLVVGDRVEENAVWGYANPFDEVAGLEGYVAFYTDRVDLQER
jgi:uncharacterized protein (DUF427 family)